MRKTIAILIMVATAATAQTTRFATEAYASWKADIARSNAAVYTDGKIAALPPATNATAISGGALAQATNVAEAVVAAAAPTLAVASAATVTGPQSTLIETAWQNPANAANWTWTSNGREITLTGYSGPAAVVIPDMLDGLPVTGFGTIFAADQNITSVGGGQFITTIGYGAFAYSSLATANFPQVTTIGNYAFEFAASLTTANFPQATTIGYGAFAYSSLATANFPQVTTIGNYAFENTLLTSLYLGQNAPAEAGDVFSETPNVTVYVTDPTSTGYGATWNGAPVVRPPLYGSNVTAQAFTLGGDTITEWPTGGGGETSIIAPLYESGTNVTVTSTKSVYSVSVTGAGPVGIDWSGLALDGTGRAEVTLRLNVTEWDGTNVTFSPAMTFDLTPEILVTGVWEFAASTVDGATTRVRQTWPEVVECNVLVPQIAFGGSASLAHGGNRLQTLGTGRDGLIQYYWPLCGADVVMVRIDAAAASTSGFPLGSFCDYRVEGYNVSISPIVTNRCEITASNPNVGGPVTTFKGTADRSSFPVSSMIRLRRLILSDDPSSTNAHIFVNAAYRELNANERAAYAAGWRP